MSEYLHKIIMYKKMKYFMKDMIEENNRHLSLFIFKLNRSIKRIFI